MGDLLGIPGAVGFWPPLFFSPHTPGMAVSASPTCPWLPSHATALRAGITQRHWRPKSWAPAAPVPPRMGGRGPTPAADLGCLSAAREPLHILFLGNQTTCGSPSGAPLAYRRQSPGLHQPQPQSQPHRRSRVLARARTHTQILVHRWCMYLVEL